MLSIIICLGASIQDFRCFDVQVLTFGGAFCGGHPTNISVDIFCEPELVWVPIGDFPVLGAIWYPKQYEISLQNRFTN